MGRVRNKNSLSESELQLTCICIEKSCMMKSFVRFLLSNDNSTTKMSTKPTESWIDQHKVELIKHVV